MPTLGGRNFDPAGGSKGFNDYALFEVFQIGGCV
jgi:hypothetical protein